MQQQKILNEAEDKMKKSLDLVIREFNSVRTGRASSGLVEMIKVDYYGAATPLKQLANISAPEPRLIIIHPWDPNSLVEIEKAILKSDIGITPSNDGKLIRLSVPQLTQERREELVKVTHKMAEEQRVAIRSIRRDANEHLKKAQKEGTVTEDDSFKAQEEVQKLTNKYISKTDESLKNKEKEIMEV
ncbi:MAG: ribosome recycling factor [Candidatus Omnitrophota bacterium]